MSQKKTDKDRTGSVGGDPDSPRPLFNAWISPAGRIIPVDIGYHNNYVIEYLEETYGKEYLLTMKTTSHRELNKYLEDQGWIRVMNWATGEFNFVFPPKLHLPQCQKKAVANICIDNNIPIPKSLCD